MAVKNVVHGGAFMSEKKIGVLASGGDAPGMNAAIRAVVRAGLSRGMQVVGIRRGYTGLLAADAIPMDFSSVSGIISKGGSILYSARSKEFKTSEGVLRARDNCKQLGLDGLVVIGGDGSLRGATELSEAGIPCVLVPATIDNDVPCSEYSIGFDTASNTAIQMIDKIRDTAEAFERCIVVEVMGRRCGNIALKTGISAGATAILLPEADFDLQKDVIDKIKVLRDNGQNHFIMVVAEGVGGLDELTQRIADGTGVGARSTVLGHVQRGGVPTVRDRVIATEMGAKAVEVLAAGGESKVISMNGGKIVAHDILEGMDRKTSFDVGLYQTALRISI